MSDIYDYPDADAIPPVKPKAPHTLTREQVEELAGYITNAESKWYIDQWLDHDEEQRQTLAQQAQEIERLRKALRTLWRMTEIYKTTDLDVDAVISKALNGA